MNYLPLLGILIIILGFAFRFSPMVVVPVAAIATGLLAGLDLVEVISKLGKAFNDSRLIAVPWIVLPVIGLLERYGLQQRAKAVIGSFRAATAGRVLILYLLYRQGISAIGLHTTAGHPQTVRPLVAPMAVAAAEKSHGPLDEATGDRVKAFAAATDNVGLFFGEDIFFAIGSIILIQQILEGYGIALSPLELAVWAIPSAVAAFLVHSARLLLLDRSLKSSPAFAGEGDRPKDGGGALSDSARTPPPRSGRSSSPENSREELP
ncbi:MAG: hypothetical protein QOJ91_2905 [Sphingomonadales bacterium]|jgi:uncharacterized membrane protein|nr:hypothetical protein [Sphingomonadales bacterium]